MAFPLLLALTLAQAGYSALNAGQAQKGLDDLDKQGRPKYKMSPELQNAYNRAEGMAGQGFTGAEKANFRQGVNQQLNTQSRRALDMGGGQLGRTVSRMGTIANLDAENKFAAADAVQHRSNMHYADSLARQIQGINNQETGAGINDYNRGQEAFGRAKNMNISNIFSSLALASQFAGGAGKTPMPAPNPTASQQAPAYQAPQNTLPYLPSPQRQDWSPYGSTQAPAPWYSLSPTDPYQSSAPYATPNTYAPLETNNPY